MSKKVIISAAITGSIHTPSLSPHLPVTPEDIAQQAIDAVRAGAAVVHVHARNPENGMPSADMSLFGKIIGKIRADSDAIICTTTGGGFGMTVEQRVAVVPEFKPEIASFNMGSINFGIFPLAAKVDKWKYDWEKGYLEGARKAVFQNVFEDMEKICLLMRDNGVKPELEIYDVGHLYSTAYLLDKGLLDPPIYLQFVMGVLGGVSATIYDLVHMKQVADRLFGDGSYRWSAFGTGRDEFPICTTALLLGGNCRVGLEDNLYLEKGVLAKSNAEMVQKMIRIMKEFSLEPATPDEGRKILGITTDHHHQ